MTEGCEGRAELDRQSQAINSHLKPYVRFLVSIRHTSSQLKLRNLKGLHVSDDEVLGRVDLLLHTSDE